MEDGFILKVANTGGFTMNPTPDASKPMYCQSGHGTIVFGKTQKCKDVHFEDEIWVDRTSYPLMEDQIFYYKAYLQGNKIAYAPEVVLHHLDAGTSISGDKKLKNVFASACNTLIFHHRFVLHNPMFRHSRLAISRRIAATLTISLLQSFRNFNFSKFSTYCKGYLQGLKTIKSKEYQSLKRITGRNQE